MDNLKAPKSVKDVIYNMDIRIRHADASIYIYKNDNIWREVHNQIKKMLLDIKIDIKEGILESKSNE